MSQQTLKGLLKPPFEHFRYRILGGDTSIICKLDDGYETVDSLKAVGNFIAAAMNEKWERVFHTEEPLDKRHPHIHCPQCQYPIYKSDFDVGDDGEPLRWSFEEWKPFDNRLAVICPKCDSPFEYHAIEFSNYCPHCGQRLLPAENKEEAKE